MARRAANSNTDTQTVTSALDGVNFAQLTPSDIMAIIAKAQGSLKESQDRTRKQLKDELTARAKEHGFKSVEEVMATVYRHPNDPSKEWSGKGPKPKWVQEYLDGGKNRSKEDLAV